MNPFEGVNIPDFKVGDRVRSVAPDNNQFEGLYPPEYFVSTIDFIDGNLVKFTTDSGERLTAFRSDWDFYVVQGWTVPE